MSSLRSLRLTRHMSGICRSYFASNRYERTIPIASTWLMHSGGSHRSSSFGNIYTRRYSTQPSAEVDAVAQSISSVCASYIEALHHAVPTDWAGTIMLCAVSVRLCSLPLMYYHQLQRSRSAIASKSFPQIHQFVRRTPGTLLQKYLTFRRLRSLALKSADTSPFLARPWYLVTHIPLVIGASIGMRELAGRGLWDMAFLWLPSLSMADPTYGLPIATTALWVWNLEGGVSVREARQEKIKEKEGKEGVETQSNVIERIMTTGGNALSRAFQMACIASLSATTDLPSGLVLFWFYNASLTTAQRYIFSNVAVRRQIGLVNSDELEMIQGPNVMGGVENAMEVMRKELSYVQRNVISQFAHRRVDEDLRRDVNKALARERWAGRIRVDLEAEVREENGRAYIAVVMKGKGISS